MPVLNDEQRKQADAIVAKYPNKRSALLPLMFLVQSVEGRVTDEGMREVADILGLTPAQVLSSTSFYSMFKRNAQGEYLISVCRNIACTHLGGRKIAAALEEHLGIETGQTTPDGKFTLETAECLATCDGAPSIQINYEDFYRVTPETATELVAKVARGEEVRSVRGQVVRTSKEISHETACAGLLLPQTGEMEDMRTICGETPPADTAPGHRPPEKGHRD